MKHVYAGAIGGLLATVPMTIAMEELHRTLPQKERHPLPPRQITEDLLERSPMGNPLSNTSLTALTMGAHFIYGAAAGALCGPHMLRSRQPVLRGAALGVAVWVASYLGWIPAARVLSPATRHPARRNLLMLAVHCVWGASTAILARMLTEPGTHGFSRGKRWPSGKA